MGRYTGAKNRIARKFGVNIFGRLRNPLIHKPNPPGMHGNRRRKKSDFGMQLEEKQKLKAVYGMVSEKQLLLYYKEAVRRTGNTAHSLLEMMECRLDNLVYRLRLGNTIFAAQQLISHGHILVDGKKVDRRSFQVKPGMTISVKEKSQKLACIADAQARSLQVTPEYLSVGSDNLSGQLTSVPSPEQISLPLEINIPVVCEFLAHSN